jgi:IS5 family transposase
MEPDFPRPKPKRKIPTLVAVAILERAVMDVLVDLPPDHFVPFRVIAAETGLGEELVRAILRQLRAAGLEIYSAGLWTDNGEPAGAGYAASRKVRFRRLALTTEERAAP